MSERPWLASYRAYGIPSEIPAPEFPSVTAMMESAMVRFANKPALHSFGQTLTYADVDRLSRAFAAWLQAQGVKRGDRIAVMTPNILAFPVAMLGIIRAGAAQVNVNPLYTPRELQHQLRDAGCQMIVVFSGATPTLAEIVDQTPVRSIVTAGLALAADSPLPSPPVDSRLKDSVSLIDALAQGATLPFTPVTLAPDDLLFLQYTGGTTGLSKGAALSHGNLLANVAQFSTFMPEALRPAEEVIVTAIPLYHIFALMVNFISYFQAGAENWLVANPRDMDAFVATLGQARPTVFTAVNTLFAGLTMHPKTAEVDWSRLHLAVGGGAAIIPTVSARWQAITGQFIREGYGLSETSPVLTFNPAAVTEFSGTTGLPVPSTDIKLLDDNDREVGIGEAGEVCTKGPQVMAGYWEKPQANAEAFTADGYFRTGDIGVFDDRGFLKIVDRKKDMVIVSGFNVYPNDVEAVASACPGVAECACVGVPDEKSGEAVKLFVVRSAGASITEDDVITFCRNELAGYKVPRIVQFLDALPKSTVGKILRRELRGV
ncbi:MAG: AMP-binding protein [Burkholderiaceae bacterium]